MRSRFFLRARFFRCGCSLEFDSSLLKRSARDLPCAGGLEIPQETSAGGFGREATIANVGQAVAVGVGAIGVRMPRKIDSHTLRRQKARPVPHNNKANA